MKLDILFHYEVNEQTGEITYIGKEEISVDTKATKSATKTSTKASAAKVDTNPDPIITLDSNKLILTQGAVDLLQVCADCRVDIKYKKKDKKAVPIIGTDEAFGTKGGNKLTKSNTIACRGSKNEELSKYGKEFVLAVHPSKAGLFVLTSEEVAVDQLVGDDNVNIDTPEGIDLNLEGLVDDEDANVSSIDTNFFKL